MNADDTKATWKRLAQQAAQSPHVEAEVQQLVNALADKRDTHISCEQCRMKLAHFIAVEQSGFDAVQMYPEVKRHMDTCPTCESSYVDTFTLMEIEAQVDATAPDIELDLSFLPSLSFTQYLRDVAYDIVERAYPAFLATFNTDIAAFLAPLQRGLAPQVRERPIAYGATPSVEELAYMTYISAETLISAATAGTENASLAYQTAYAHARERGFSDDACARFAAAFTETVVPTIAVLRSISND